MISTNFCNYLKHLIITNKTFCNILAYLNWFENFLFLKKKSAKKADFGLFWNFFRPKIFSEKSKIRPLDDFFES